MADWGLTELLLRRIDLGIQGGNWQRGGGKGQKPKPVELPQQHRTRPAKPAGDDIARRLANLGLIPAGTTD